MPSPAALRLLTWLCAEPQRVFLATSDSQGRLSKFELSEPRRDRGESKYIARWCAQFLQQKLLVEAPSAETDWRWPGRRVLRPAAAAYRLTCSMEIDWSAWASEGAEAKRRAHAEELARWQARHDKAEAEEATAKLLGLVLAAQLDAGQPFETLYDFPPTMRVGGHRIGLRSECVVELLRHLLQLQPARVGLTRALEDGDDRVRALAHELLTPSGPGTIDGPFGSGQSVNALEQPGAPAEISVASAVALGGNADALAAEMAWASAPHGCWDVQDGADGSNAAPTCDTAAPTHHGAEV
jgi:hypothetical protein